MGFFAKLFKKDNSELLTFLEEKFDKIENHLNQAQLNQTPESKEDNSGNSESTALIGALIDMCDSIEAFKVYADTTDDPSLVQQARIMWRQANKKLAAAGLTRIEDIGTIFDYALNTAAQTTTDNNMPDGVILEVIKSGYVYKTQVIRKSSVVINKL